MKGSAGCISRERGVFSSGNIGLSLAAFSQIGLVENHESKKLQFADQLVAIQKALYSYIFTLLPRPDEASDVLQQTNLALWRDAVRYQPGTDFRAWAYRVAYYQVLAQRRKTQRSRLGFDEALLRDLAENMEREAVDLEQETLALRDCLKLLPEQDKELIFRRYEAGISVKLIAEELKQTPGAVAVRLHRIRRSLLKCMDQRLSEQEQR